MTSTTVPVQDSCAADSTTRLLGLLPGSHQVGVRVDVTGAWSDEETIQREWAATLLQNSELTLFSSEAWLRAWWNAFGQPDTLEFSMFSTADHSVGFAPFFRARKKFLGKKLIQLRMVGAGSGDSDGLDLALRSGCEQEAINALLQSHAKRVDWDICSLETLSSGSAIGKLLPESLQLYGWPYHITRVPRWCVPLPDSWNQYIDGLPPEFRPLLTRYPKRLDSRYECTVKRCQSETELERYLPILFDLHQRRWQDAGRPGAFALKERRQFFSEVAHNFLGKGWLDFWVMELNGVPVALQFCCHYGETVHLLQEGFDPAYNKDKVGYALRAKALQHYIQVGMKHYDFMAGSDPYKQKYGAIEDYYLTIEFAKPKSLGAVYLQMQAGKRSAHRWLRCHLPEDIVSQVREFQKRRSIA